MDTAALQGEANALNLPNLPKPFRGLEVVSRHDNRLVLRVRRNRAEMPVILKCLLPPLDRVEVEEFQEEYLHLDAVAHPYWIRPGRFGRLPEGGYYFELQQAHGSALGDFPVRGWHPEILEIARRILSGLEALHRIGVAHLDLKPEQVLVSWQGSGSRGWNEENPEGIGERLELYLLDLGLAAPFGTPLMPRGTVGYMAPEILARRSGWDGRADLYAFGVILHELLTGRPVFAEGSPRAVLRAQLEGAALDLREVSGHLPAELPRLLHDLLAIDPDDRPSSAWEVWTRLRTLAPQKVATELPAQLTGSPHFMFRERKAEIDRFCEWARGIAEQDSAPSARCRITGEPGIGRRRLAARLAAVAQTDGWVLESAPAQGVRADPEAAREREAATESAGDPRSPRRGARSDNNQDSAATGERHEYRLTRFVPAGTGPEEGAESRRVVLRIIADLSGEGFPPTESSADVEARDGELRLRPPPFEKSDLISLVHGRGLESATLAARLGELSLGNPGLLHAIVDQLPREFDIGSRHLDEAELDQHLDRLPCPPAWVSWVRALFQSVDASSRDALLQAAFATADDADLAFSVVAERGLAGTAPELVRMLVDRGLLVLADGAFRFASRSWSRAFEAADPRASRSIGRRFLSQLPDPRGREAAVLARLALRIEDWEQLQRFFDPALAALHDAMRYEEELNLFAEVVGGAPKELPLVTRAMLTRLAATAFTLTGSAGDALPELTIVDGSPPDPRTLLIRVYNAWRLAGARRWSESIETLGGLDAGADEPLALAWIYLRKHALAVSGKTEECLGELDRRLAETPETNQRRRVLLDAMALEVVSTAGRLQEADKLAERIGRSLSHLSEPERAKFHTSAGLVTFQMGLTQSAHEHFEASEAIWRRRGFEDDHLMSLNNLGGLAYQAGELVKVQGWGTRVFHEWWKREKWANCVMALDNLALVALQRGLLGLALRTARDACPLAARVPGERAEREAKRMESLVLMHLGSLDLSIQLIQSELTRAVDDLTPYFLAVAGEATILQGQVRPGRQLMRRALDRFQTSKALDDVSERLVSWMVAEFDQSELETAIQLYDEMGSLYEFASTITRIRLLLIEAEMTALGWLDADADGPGAVEMLENAAETLRRKDLSLYRWRPHWRLGQIYHERGRFDDARREYDTARSLLTDLARSVGEVRLRRAFLNLPAQRRFLSELSVVTGPARSAFQSAAEYQEH